MKLKIDMWNILLHHMPFAIQGGRAKQDRKNWLHRKSHHLHFFFLPSSTKLFPFGLPTSYTAEEKVLCVRKALTSASSGSLAVFINITLNPS